MSKQIYERIGTLPLEKVFSHIGEHINETKRLKVVIDNYLVNVTSTRLRTFYHTGVCCYACDKEALFFAVERSHIPNKDNKTGYHLNLYGKNDLGEEILYTHDHLQARALGGEDNLNNTQTMCGPCNWEKGRLEGKIKKTEDEEEKKAIEQEINEYIIKKELHVKKRIY